MGSRQQCGWLGLLARIPVQAVQCSDSSAVMGQWHHISCGGSAAPHPLRSTCQESNAHTCTIKRHPYDSLTVPCVTALPSPTPHASEPPTHSPQRIERGYHWPE
jgi:hypothetical protein